jgi:hypothetical protein
MPRVLYARRAGEHGVRPPVNTLQGYTRSMGLRDDYGLPPDPVVEYYKKDVDRTLLREHLKLTPQQRLEKLMAFMRSLDQLRTAARHRR